jgi:DNA-binding transcriptional LysR family regulator
MMELRQLEHFVAAAEERHFTRAARRSNIVQSGLSASIRSLEEELGSPLFIRTTRQVDLTPEGRAFLAEARRVLAAVQSAQNAVAEVKGLLRGTLSIGVMQRMPSRINLARLLCRFHGEHPGVEIHLRQAGSPALLAGVQDGQLDVAFGIRVERDDSALRVSVLAREPLVLVCFPGHPLAAQRKVALEQLADEPFIDFPPDWATRALVDRAFAIAQIRRRVVFEMNEVSNLIDFVAMGLGVAIVPRFTVAAESQRVRMVPLDPSPPQWELILATPQDRPRSPAAMAFESMVHTDGEQ